MCNFLITNILNADKNKANKFQKFRGPDFEKTLIFNQIFFMHNLLSITGTFFPQPYEDSSVIVCFNGEIYNHYEFGTFKSDVEVIPYLYKKGIPYLKKLEGEFAIVIYDKKLKNFTIVHDLFAIKPLFLGLRSNTNQFCISSYPSASQELKMDHIQKIPANGIFRFEPQQSQQKKPVITKIMDLYQWNLKQHKKSYKDIFTALEYAVLRRAITSKNILVNLSSGYDSGVICCVLNKYHIPYNTASIAGKEDMSILNRRLSQNHPKKFAILIKNISDDDRKKLKNYINKNTENHHIDRFFFKNNKMQKGLYNFKTDKAIIGAARIYSEVRDPHQVRVVLSGSGADEIFSDYGHNGNRIFSHSCFGGKFPGDLSRIFPKNSEDVKCVWKNFYHSCQEAYLWKDEVITGLYGMEGRYPFLDKNLVQEFLWLSPELKNREYKGFLKKYLEAHNYPFTPKKIGFNIS